MPVAIQTPAHAERLLVNHDWHLIHLAVTAHATDPASDMDGMIEVHVIGRFMDPLPSNRGTTRPAHSHRLKLRAVCFDRLVAIHARLRGRDLRDGRLLDTGVAVEARQPQAAGVLLVGELDWLDRREADARVLGRLVVVQTRQAKDGREDRSGGHAANPGISLPSEDESQDCLLALISEIEQGAIMAPICKEELGYPRKNGRPHILRNRQSQVVLGTDRARHDFLGQQSATKNPTDAMIRIVGPP
jgi:hypothetical protein